MTKEGMGDEAMKKSLFYRAKKMPPSAQIMLLFAVEGVFLQYITSARVEITMSSTSDLVFNVNLFHFIV